MKLKNLFIITLALFSFTFTVSAGLADFDQDGIEDGLDNCPTISNSAQDDQDSDDVGDVCDSDRDGDGENNSTDNCPDLDNPGQEDLDRDGQGDDCDTDVDGDDVDDVSDNCPLISNNDQADLDTDGEGDVCDDDADGDTFDDIQFGGTDCDDLNDTIHPNATEICDGLDNNCDRVLDQEDAVGAVTWYFDSDSDTFGDINSTIVSCDAPMQYVADNTDCDDNSQQTYPGANELCFDAADNDCDGTIDETDATDAPTWFEDSDDDGEGNILSTITSCTIPTGYVDNSSDCDDTNPNINTSAGELCNDNIDNNCSGEQDEPTAIDVTEWNPDLDGDGFGAPVDTVIACTAPTDYVNDVTDCDDTQSNINSAAQEICDDGVDNDCDTEVDGDDEDCQEDPIDEDPADEDPTDEDPVDEDPVDEDPVEDDTETAPETETEVDPTTSAPTTTGGVQFAGTSGCSLTTTAARKSPLNFGILFLILIPVFLRFRMSIHS